MRGDVHRRRAPHHVRGSEQRGDRFGVVVQSDDLLLSTLLIAPTSRSAVSRVFRPTVVVAGTPTQVLVEQTTAVAPERLHPCSAHLTPLCSRVTARRSGLGTSWARSRRCAPSPANSGLVSGGLSSERGRQAGDALELPVLRGWLPYFSGVRPGRSERAAAPMAEHDEPAGVAGSRAPEGHRAGADVTALVEVPTRTDAQGQRLRGLRGDGSPPTYRACEASPHALAGFGSVARLCSGDTLRGCLAGSLGMARSAGRESGVSRTSDAAVDWGIRWSVRNRLVTQSSWGFNRTEGRGNRTPAAFQESLSTVRSVSFVRSRATLPPFGRELGRECSLRKVEL